MRKVNTNKIPEVTWTSPKGKFSGAGKEFPKNSDATRNPPTCASGIRSN